MERNIKLYIDFKQHKRVLASDTTAIKAYSSECAALYGDVIHLPRVMASTFTDQDFKVYDDCIAMPSPRSKQLSQLYNNKFAVFPNPSNGLIYVSLPENYVGNYTLYNYIGQFLWQRKLDRDKQIMIDLADQKGINLLHFLSDSGTVKVIKVVIVK